MMQFRKGALVFSIIIMLVLLSCGDKEPPLVKITNPVDGSYVNGTVLVTAEATDNKEVDSVKIYIDDALVARFANPYAYYQWNTDSLPHNSVHYINATSFDHAENIGFSDTVSVTIQYFGTLKWRYQFVSTISNISSPAIGSDGTIYFGATEASPPIPPPGYLFALSPDGILKWICETVEWNSTPAIGSDGTIYVGNSWGSYPNGFLHAIDANGILKWCYYTDGAVVSAPAVVQNGTIYFGAYDSCLYALNPDSTLKWHYQTGAPVTSSPSIASDGTIYLGSNDGNLYALNPDGTLKWLYQTNGAVQSSPSIASDGTVYFGSWDGFLYAVYGSAPLASIPWPKFRHDLKNTGQVGGY